MARAICYVTGTICIISTLREKKCTCGKKECYCCPHLGCNSCICKVCAKEKDQNIVHRITVDNEDNSTTITLNNNVEEGKNCTLILEEVEYDPGDDIVTDGEDAANSNDDDWSSNSDSSSYGIVHNVSPGDEEEGSFVIKDDYSSGDDTNGS